MIRNLTFILSLCACLGQVCGQGSAFNFEDLVVARMPLPANCASYASYSTLSPNLVLSAHAGGVMAHGYDQWFLSPQDNRVILCAVVHEADQAVYMIYREKAGVFLGILSRGSHPDSVRSVLCLPACNYRLYQDDEALLLLGSFSDSTTFLRIDMDDFRVSGKAVIDTHVSDLTPYRDGQYLCAVGASILLVDVAHQRYTVALDLPMYIYGIAYDDQKRVLVSYDGGLLLFSFEMPEQVISVGSDAYGALTHVSGKHLMHSQAEKMLYVLELPGARY